MDKPRFQVRVELPSGDLHRFSIIPSLSFGALHAHLLDISALKAITVTYLDEEGDKVTLTNEEEFVEAKRALDIGTICALRLTLSADTTAQPQKEKATDKPLPTPRACGTGKTRKIGHYPQLAEEIGELVHASAPKECEAASKNTQTIPETNDSLPEWRDSFVTNASREISNVLDSLLKSVTAEPASLLTASCNSACHLGILCSVCNKTILGNRYKCGNCPQFDLCELCLLTPDVHDPTHVLLLLRVPCPAAGYTDGRPVPILQDNLYSPRAVSGPSRAASEHAERQTALAHVYMDKKLKKAMKLERKMKKILPQHVDAQVEAFKSTIQNKRKEIKDMKEMMKATKRFGYVPFGHEERGPERTTPTQLTDYEYSARMIRDKGECISVYPCQRASCKWLVENNGQSFWSSVRFHCVSGNFLSEERQVSLPFCSSGDQIELEVPFTAPEEQGYFYSNWRLSHYGKAFGPPFKAEVRVSYGLEQELLRKNVEVDSGAEDDEDLASADQGFAIKAFPGAGGMQQPLIAISHGDYLEDPLVNSMQALPIEDNDSIDLDATELLQDERPTSSLFSEDLLADPILPTSSPPLDIPMRLMSNLETASIASSSADSFIVVQMPDSFDSNKPIYLSQGSEVVPANLLSGSNREADSSEFSSPISSPEPVSPSAVPSLPPIFLTHSPQPNVSITSLSSISPMSSIKSFVSSVADKLDDSLTRKQQQDEMFSSTYEDFKPFEIEFDIQTSLPLSVQEPSLTPLAITPIVQSHSSFSLQTPSIPPVSVQAPIASPPQFVPELPSSESFMLPSGSSYCFNAKALTSVDNNMWLSQTQGSNLDPHSGQDDSKWIASQNSFPNFLFTNDNEAWIAPSANWKPKQPTTPLERLMKMGFCNRELNLSLLEKFSNNLELVINALIEESDTAWPQV